MRILKSEKNMKFIQTKMELKAGRSLRRTKRLRMERFIMRLLNNTFYPMENDK